jgi:hypothetical protein
MSLDDLQPYRCLSSKRIKIRLMGIDDRRRKQWRHYIALYLAAILIKIRLIADDLQRNQWRHYIALYLAAILIKIRLIADDLQRNQWRQDIALYLAAILIKIQRQQTNIYN